MAARATKSVAALQQAYPWTQWPLVALAPMRHTSGPEAAVAVSSAGGIGIMNPMFTRDALLDDLAKAKALLQQPQYRALAATTPDRLPLGLGFLIWGVDLATAVEGVKQYRPSLAWLYAPANGQDEVNEWTAALRAASPTTKIWHMVGTLHEVQSALSSPHPPDVLVVQGIEAGGHGRTNDGFSWSTLFPEASDLAKDSSIPLFVAGGIVDGRGVAAALSLGAAGVCMGTRFLASHEARISKGYQDEVLRATDGASSTTKTHLWNHLVGTFGWPKEYTPRGIINKSFTDQQAGVPFDELKKRHDEAKALGDAAWGPDGRTATYAGAAVGLVRAVMPAAAIVREVRQEALDIFAALASFAPPRS